MSDHKRKKKRGRSKFFRSCFRSHERPLLSDKSDGRSFNHGRLEKEFDTDAVNADVTGDCFPERSTNGRGVSRMLKAVLFDLVMAKKIRSNSKSSIASDTNDAFLSIEKTGKQSEDCNVCSGETMDVEDASSRSNLLSSSSRETSSSYSSSSSSSKNSNSRWLSEPKTSSPVDILDPDPSVSSNLSSNPSSLQKSNIINSGSCCYNKYGSEERFNVSGCQPHHLLCCSNNSRSCSEQKSSSQTDSNSFSLAKSTSLPKPSPYNKQLSQSELSDSVDTITSGCNNWNIRWCLFLLLSLIVLVIYGRLYSILCTSIWFYLVPLGRVKRVDSVTDTAELVDIESEQYKKRVIMAGLLDRTRNPVR